jgi:hypothetical protein
MALKPDIRGYLLGRFVVVILLLLVSLFFLSKLAHAHDHWINRGNYTAPDGITHCCGTHTDHDTGEVKGDCFKLSKKQVDDRGDTFFIKPLGKEFERKYSYPSEDGDYWYCGIANSYSHNGFYLRCFFYPAGGV